MFLKKYKPITPSLRSRRLVSKKFLKLNFKKLNMVIRQKAGRNHYGFITVRHRGGGAFSFFKKIDLFRNYKVESKFIGMDYDKRRSSFIGLYQSNNKGYRYLLPPFDMSSKNVATCFLFRGLDRCLGDTMPIGWIPKIKTIFNVELEPSKGGVLARSAGTFCKIVKNTKKFTEIKIPSGLLIKLSPLCFATIGRSSNINHRFERYSYAGYFRHLGRRPSVRGEAMNAVDHPHGGKTHGGKPQMTPWGRVIK